MSNTLASLVVKLTGDTGEFQRSMQDAEQDTSRLANTVGEQGSKIGGLGSIMQGAFSWVTGNVIMKGIDAVVGSFGSLKAGMIDGNAEFERYQTQFGVLLGSTDAAKKRLDELAKFGASTPFELPEVVKADKILQGFGLHSVESAKKFGFTGEQIRTIAGDVASGTGTSFEEMSNYIGKFSSGATGEVISRFQELGITTREELTGLGLEFNKSGQLMSPLPQATQVVLDLMKKKYGGMMDAQGKTFEGMMSNLNDWVAGTLRTIGAPIFEVLKDKLKGVLEFLGSPAVQSAIAGFATTLANGIGQAITLITPIISTISTVIDGVVGAISGSETTFGDWSLWWEQLSSVIGTDAADAIMGIVFKIGDMVGFVQANLPTVQAAVTSAIGAAVSFVQQNWPFIEQIIGTVITNVKAFIDNPLTPYMAFVIGLFGQVVTWVQENWPLISQTVGTVLNAINNIVTVALPIVRDVFTTVFSMLRPIVEGALTLVLGIIKTVMQLINGDTSGALQTLSDTFSSIFGGIVSAIDQKLAEMGRMLAAAWVDFQGKVEIAWNQLKDTITGAVQGAIDWINGIGTTLSNLGNNIIAGIIAGITSAPQSILNTLSGIVNGAIDAIKRQLGIASPSRVFAGIGGNMMMGLAQGIEKAGGLPSVQLNGVVSGLADVSMPAARGGAGRGNSVQIEMHFHGNADAAAVEDGTMRALRRAGLVVTPA